MCQLCSGYLIDATGIIECQHTFCKSCILKYLETNSYCPICDVQLNKADPQYSLRSDVIIQRLVYKLVPGLLVSESRRRRDLYIKNDMEPVAAAELAANSLAVEIEAASDMSTVLSLDDVVSLSIEYFRSDDKTSTTNPGSTEPNGKQQQSTTAPSSATQSCQNQQQKSNVKSSSVNSSSGGTSIPDTNANAASSTDNNGSDNSNTSEQANDRRYLQCSAGVSVGLLKKFIRRKYGLSDDYRVDLLYNGNRDNILEIDLTLLDVAFIYKWNKDDPMKFQYRIFERPPKSMTIYSGMKRPANSMMDEPPDDDDTASGPPNGSSMFSSSTAPSSKLPRLGDNTANTTSQGKQGNVTKDNTSGKSTTTSVDPTPTPTSTASTVSCKTSASSSTTHTAIKVEKEEVDEDDDDEDDEEDYELVERKEHMKGIKSSRKNSIKESMKRSVAASNLRSHISRPSSSHSTDTKDSVDSERESGNENSLNSSNSASKNKNNANLAKKQANSYEVKGSRPRGRPPKHVDSLRLRVTSSDNSRAEPQSTGSLKMSISTSGITPVVSSSPGDEKKDPIKLSLGTVLASKGGKSPERKHHKRKHHHHHKLRHRDKQSKGLSSSSSASSSPPTNQKPIKLSFTLSPPGTATVQQTQGNQSQKSTTLIKPSQDSGMEMKEQKGKPLAGTHQNYNNSARTSASAHGHLNNISKSISVSINTNVNSNVGAPVSNAANKGGPHGNKILSPAELIPKNTGMEIQPTTIPISSSHGQISQHSMQQQNINNVPSNNSHKHSHPLLPDSVHVPKSVTLIPVNPNSMNLNSSNSSGSGGSSLEKGGSGSHHGNQNRINSHTFTHPITNKSLHQITVTEVPPPQKQGGGMGNSSLGNHNNTGMGNNQCNSTLHSSISGTTSNPIEKVIANANASNNKPQFNGPGTMEITKINCWTATSKENPAKKLKDRRGLDISITGTGINVNLKKTQTQKLEETLRQKVNIATGGGSNSISVTPVAPPNSHGSGNFCNNVITTSSSGSGSSMNKMKSVAATAASLLSGKMPPGITIGPATVPQNSSNNGNNPVSNNINNNSGGSNSANVGNNIMKGLGFTLPPHLTAHPHNPNNMKNLGNQGKSDKMPANNMHMNNSRLLGKDSVSIIGKGGAGIAGGQQHQPPPPVEITISATGGNKSQANITNRGVNIVNNSKMSNDPLASIFDITQGLKKSPTPAVNNNAKDNNSKQQISIPTQNVTQGGNVGGSSMNTKNMANKRPYDMSASSNSAQTGNKKVTKETPEMKRARSASTSSEPGSSAKQSGKPEGEIPLDLSGRSTRTTPPIIIPHREPSKSPTATTNPVKNEKRVPSKSPEIVKSGKVISPSSSSSTASSCKNNFPSPKMNTQKNSAVEPFNKGQQPSKSVSVSKLSPNQASKIGSIVDSLAQKQAQAQAQQHLQNVKNSQIQQQQHRSQSHHHSSNVTSNPSNSTHSNTNANQSGMPNLKINQSNSNNAGKTSSSSSVGITSPIPASSSMISSGMPMTSPSPPGTDHMRNLWTLSDTAVRQGKLNSMNELLVAASLFSPPGHPHPLAGAAAAHQLAAAAAAGSPSGAYNSNMMAQLGHQLAAFGAVNKIPPGMLDHHVFAAAMSAHNAQAHAAASGMRIGHPFAGSMSPPLNAFYPHGAPAGQQQTPLPGAALGPKMQNSPSASANKSGICGTGKSNSMPFAPLFSHSVPVSSPKSPNSGNLSASGGTPSVKTPTTCNSIPPSVLPFSSPVTNSGMSNHSGSSATNKDQKPTHTSSGKGSSTLPVSGGVGGKSTKINGTMSTAMPVFPPGIHNPLLQPRSIPNINNSSNSSGNSFQSGSSTGASPKTFPVVASPKTFPTVAALSNKNASKGGIPNSMKISNFLPSKPKDSASDANTEATITSGSNFGIPPLQSKPNFSLSPSRSPSDSLSLHNSMNIPKSPSFKDGPLSPVKSVASSGTAGASISPTNKPSSLTCASLLLPDSMYSKPSTHHLLNSLSPTKGDHGNSGLYRSNRTPSSDSILLSPNSSPTHKARSTSPGGSSYAFPKPGSRSDDISGKPHRTISPTKDELSSKKEEGGIPMGASLARTFTPSTTSSISSQLTHNAQCLSLTRPIPTISAFFNRSSNSTSAPMSSNTNSNISHHHQQTSLSPGRMPTSPVKMSNNQQHLPSPVFPFPGVSVPVQVKLQEDSEEASVAIASNATITATTTSVTTLPTHSLISLKSEVNKVMAAKEEKVEEKRKRSCSSPPTPADSKFGTGDSKPTQILPEPAPCKTNLVRENSLEISPAKVQKIEIQATAPSTVKNELEKQERLIISQSESSETVNNVGSISKVESMERKENESQSSSQRESEKGGEQGKDRRSESEGEADPSKEFSTGNASTTTLHEKSQSPCKAAISSPVALSQTQTELPNPEKEQASLVISIEEEKSETQIVADTECPKSDETRSEVNHQKSKTCEIPEEKENGQIIGTVTVEGEKTEDSLEDDIDIEMVNEKEEGAEIHAEVKMDFIEDNQMEIDVDSNTEKMDDIKGKVVTEERLILTKEDDDVEVDILDVGVEEPMEVATDEIINSAENEHMEEEAVKRGEIYIDNEDNIPTFPADNNHDNDSNFEIIKLPENPSADLYADALKENEMGQSRITEKEVEDVEENSIFLPENEFSQDDSECGDLVIDLDPKNDEEDTDDNKVEETDELVQVSSAISEPSQEEILKEVTSESSSPETKNEIALNEPFSTFPINSQDETIEEQAGKRLFSLMLSCWIKIPFSIK